MFGISALGWLHTIGSLPAIPLAAYMFIKHGRITPRSSAGIAYFISMMIGGLTVFLVAKQPVSPVIGAVTILLLLAGYGVDRIGWFGRAGVYFETILLSLTAFLLMVPSVSETLRRVPDGHPIVTDPQSPLLKAALGLLALILVVGVIAQMVYLRKKAREAHPRAA
ncbi:hypothetical protein DYL59_19500 [Pseudomonas kairouanensis]|uniref:Uncharacterized protein n=1 Tax=Pseudomonas kairouanensis TaxID=2293832 RepID=A0A4Z0AL74_9PSED|nr:hypothetical protein [Pseudomonas kairouanensis]TFY87167.1 hypothetical protein DYL59_19500 [Pseudomonas kairouanensis]